MFLTTYQKFKISYDKAKVDQLRSYLFECKVITKVEINAVRKEYSGKVLNNKQLIYLGKLGPGIMRKRRERDKELQWSRS
jgi:hypothetical protein